jgi:anaerobic selenocysteine-containing dehydrogenase
MGRSFFQGMRHASGLGQSRLDLHSRLERHASLGIASGDRIEITSDSGRITAVAAADETVRPGVLSLSHAWGVLPDDPNNERGGGEMACVSLLIDSSRDVEAINAMPRMSGIPVNIQRLDRAANV